MTDAPSTAPGEMLRRSRQRLAVLEQAHQAELSLLLEARQRQQQKLHQLQQAVETQKQQLAILDTSLSKGQAA